MATRPRLTLIAALAAALVSTAAVAKNDAPGCQGADLIAKAKAETPEKYAAFEADALKVPNGEGLLWKIEAKGGPASYLFGTMHTTQTDLVDLSEPVREALHEAKTVAVELADSTSPQSQAETTAYVTQNGIDLEGKGLEGLNETEAAEVRRRLAEAGMPEQTAPMLKPWFLGITLEMSACELKKMSAGALTIDQTVEKIGKEAGAKIVGLETIQEQLDAISKISEATARRMIRDSVAKRSSGDDLQATTLALYRARRIGWYYAMKPETFGEAFDLSAYKDFLEDIVDRRNRLMVERAKPLIDQGAVLIAVGALHLPGPKGLVELLRDQGYEVSKVW